MTKLQAHCLSTLCPKAMGLLDFKEHPQKYLSYDCNSFTSPSELSVQWNVVSAQTQAVPNLLQRYHMVALSSIAGYFGTPSLHITAQLFLCETAQKKANDNLGCIKQGTSSKDERATGAFLWDIACSTHHPLFQKH